MARDATGEGCDARALTATCYCAVGAIQRAAIERGGGGEAVFTNRARAEDRFGDTIGTRYLSAWNDVEGRTVEEVVAAFERAASLA
jgi:hypothetical protein